MKELKIEVPSSQIEVIDDFFEQYNIKSSKITMEDDNQLFIIRIREDQTNNILHELKARGIGEIFGRITLSTLDLYLSADEPHITIQPSPAANVEEIIANIVDSAVLSWGYIALVVLSGMLAAFGLLSNSIVIIIGSMIVAPLLGPVALTSLGVLVPERGLFKKGLIAEGIGIGLTIAIGLLVGIIMRIDQSDITDQMKGRAAQADPVNNIIFAIVSGLAAGLIISKGQSLSIVGVAIAASLAPPAATIGLYLSLFDLNNALMAGLLLAINILAINASCSFMFSIFRLAGKSGVSKRQAKKTARNIRIITVIVLLAFFYLSSVYLRLLEL